MRRIVIAGAVVVLVAVVVAILLNRSSDAEPTGELAVTWGGGEGDPPCVYRADEHTVEAKVVIEGRSSAKDEVTVTITAYSDENTSKPVGSRSRTVEFEGSVRMPLVLSIPVTKAPHVDEDGVAACRLSVKR